MSALGFKARVDPFFFACFLACVILIFTSGVTHADCTEVIMAAEHFQSTYLQMFSLQALVEVRARAQTHDCLRRAQRCIPFGHS